MLIPRTQILEFESHLCVRAAAMMAPNPFIPNPSEAPSLLWYGVGAPSCFHGAPSCFNAINAPGQFGDRRRLHGPIQEIPMEPPLPIPPDLASWWFRSKVQFHCCAHSLHRCCPLQSSISLLCPLPCIVVVTELSCF